MLNTTGKIIKHKIGLLNLADELGNVPKACQVMGMSRDTFYRYKSAVNECRVEALFERTRRKTTLVWYTKYNPVKSFDPNSIPSDSSFRFFGRSSQ